MFYQPRLTKMLKSMDKTSFDILGKKFEEVLGYPIRVSVVESEEEKWTVYFNGDGKGSSIRFILYVHDPSTEKFGAAMLEIQQPTIEIVDFVMYPHGQGLGTKIIKQLFHFLEEQKWGFKMMMLMAQDEKAARFWKKVGFKITNSGSSLSMIKPLNFKEKKPDPSTVRVKFQQQNQAGIGSYFK
jgi:hypothetical protein